LFVVHSPQDATFVEGFLLKALSLPNGEVLVSSKLELGAIVINEIAHGALSPVTVVVSPAFLASPWAQCATTPARSGPGRSTPDAHRRVRQIAMRA